MELNCCNNCVSKKYAKMINKVILIWGVLKSSCLDQERILKKSSCLVIFWGVSWLRTFQHLLVIRLQWYIEIKMTKSVWIDFLYLKGELKWNPKKLKKMLSITSFFFFFFFFWLLSKKDVKLAIFNYPHPAAVDNGAICILAWREDMMRVFSLVWVTYFTCHWT